MDRKKKTVLMVTLVCVAMAAVAAGIILLSIYMEKRGGQKATESRQNAVTSTAVKAEEDALKDGAVADFVGTGDLKLGDYKGIEVDTEPTEDEVLEAMESQLLKMTKDHKGRIQEGDYVCVDYKGYIDGQQYEELSEEDAVLRVGDFAQEEAFEKSLIGKQPGDKVSASVVYDDSYEELSGETVDFKITINIRRDNNLGNALPAVHHNILPGMIVERHHDLSPVIRIDHPNLVGRRQSLSAGKTASGVNQTHQSLRNLHGKAGMNKLCRSCPDPQRLFHTGIEIRSRRIFRSILRDLCLILQFLEINLRSVHVYLILSNLTLPVNDLTGCQ